MKSNITGRKWSCGLIIVVICLIVLKVSNLGFHAAKLGWLVGSELSENEPLSFGVNSNESSCENSTLLVLINTYMRSGSTFLGRILGLRSDTFYYFEPLHKLWVFSYTKGSKLCNCMKPHCEYRPDALNSSLMYLSDIFDCRFQKHSGKVRPSLLKCCSGPKWNFLTTCIENHRDVKECLVTVEKECVSTRYRVVKVLRMSLADAALLLSKHPNLVIVHLFRDPRGTFNSQFNIDWFPIKIGNINAFVDNAKAHCERITDDILTGIKLKTKFPNRVKLVQYEDIYGNAEKAKVLYKMIGMDLMDDSDQFLATQIANKINGPIEFTNLSGPFKYRTNLPFKYVKIIDEACKDALRMLGLNTYESEAELHDIEFNPVDGKLPFEL